MEILRIFAVDSLSNKIIDILNLTRLSYFIFENLRYHEPILLKLRAAEVAASFHGTFHM